MLGKCFCEQQHKNYRSISSLVGLRNPGVCRGELGRARAAFSASSEEGVTHSFTTCVLSTYVICVRLRIGEEPTWVGLACNLGPRSRGPPGLDRDPGTPCCVRGTTRERDAQMHPQPSLPEHVVTGRDRGWGISQPFSVSQAFGRRLPALGISDSAC